MRKIWAFLWYQILQKFGEKKNEKLDGSFKRCQTIDIEYNKSLDRRRPCLEDELNGESNNIVKSNKSIWRRW